MSEPSEPSGPSEPTTGDDRPPGESRELDDSGESGAGAPATQAAVGWLPRGAAEIFGAGATAEHAYELLTVDVPAEAWTAALEAARDVLGCTYFDWLSAVDEPGTGFRVCAHVAALPGGPGPAAGDAPQDTALRRLLVRTTVPHEAPVLPTATGVYAGAAWHERETHEMFGIDFTGHPHLVPLLLPEAFEGHPLRKDFVLAARVAKAWPGAKEPGESGHGGPKRRQMLPPGVPDPNEWGPLKGQLPPAPSRPARRTRSASAGSTTQRPGPSASRAEPETPDTPASEGGAPGSAGPSPAGGETPPDAAARPPRRSRSASEGSTSQREPGPGDGGSGGPAGARRSADAPWHQGQPSDDEEAAGGTSAEGEPRTAEGEPRTDEAGGEQ